MILSGSEKESAHNTVIFNMIEMKESDGSTHIYQQILLTEKEIENGKGRERESEKGNKEKKNEKRSGKENEPHTWQVKFKCQQIPVTWEWVG